MNKSIIDFRRRVGAICAITLSFLVSGMVHAVAVSPTLSGPVTGGNGLPVLYGSTAFDLASVGYSQSEFFISGTASAYLPTSPLSTDGKWAIAPSGQAGYKTRLVVNRPLNNQSFNGTVIVEWLNVSGGVDASPDWNQMHDELIRRGYVWVGVSAQAVGVNALTTLPLGDPVRYASLVHPGDSYSYDMYSQAGQAIRDNAGIILSGLNLKRVIAVGESQSAARMVTYIDAVHPLVHVYDGFLVHSRGATGASLSQAPLTNVPTPAPTLIRGDLAAPVLVFQTETDDAALGALVARQDDSAIYRLWEVTGTSHYDQYGLQIGATDTGGLSSVAQWFDSMLHPTNQPDPRFTCAVPINTGPQTFVLRAAIAALNRWLAFHIPPASAPRFSTISAQPVQYALDANGNVLGGIRTPTVDAPVATLSGLGQSGSQFCFLFGTTVPLTQEQLTTLYGNHNRFVAKWSLATLSAVAKGFILPEDALQLLVVGAQSNVLK